MPNRGLKESILTSETLEGLSAGAELLFYRLLVYVDDYGFEKADPRLVLAACFPLRVARLSPETVGGWVDELAAQSVIELLDLDGTVFLHFLNWLKHNTPRAKASKYPIAAAGDRAQVVSSCLHLHADANRRGQTHPNKRQETRDKRQETRDSSAAAEAASGEPELELTPPEGSGNGQKPPPKKTNPDIRRLIDHYAAEFARTQGAKPVIRGAASAEAAKLILAGRTFDGPKGAAWIVTKFLEDPPDWNGEKALLRLEDIPAAANKVLARASSGSRVKRAADGTPIGAQVERPIDTVETDEAGVRRRVRIWKDMKTGAELRRQWGEPLEAHRANA